jgi:hypothetical protein
VIPRIAGVDAPQYISSLQEFDGGMVFGRRIHVRHDTYLLDSRFRYIVFWQTYNYPLYVCDENGRWYRPDSTAPSILMTYLMNFQKLRPEGVEEFIEGSPDFLRNVALDGIAVAVHRRSLGLLI